jgi:surfactin synthase thioesterase subunit
MSKRVQLFCIPYAGGMAEAFRQLGACLEDEVQVIALEYAGHGTRRKEPFYPSFEELQEDVIRQIREQREEGIAYALLGYSMGSVAAYGAAAAFDGDPYLCHVFLAAHEAPDIEWRGTAYAAMDDHSFMEMLIELGGFEKVDEKLLQNRFFRQLYFQPIREDYRLLAGYQLKEKQILHHPVTIFYAPQDLESRQIRTWDGFAAEPIEYIELGESHFFIRQHAKEMAEMIRERIAEGNKIVKQ